MFFCSRTRSMFFGKKMLICLVVITLLVIRDKLKDITIPVQWISFSLNNHARLCNLRSDVKYDDLTFPKNQLENFSSVSDPQMLAFKPVCTIEEKQTLLTMVKTVINVCNVLQLHCMITDNTLIGSYHYHDLLPWVNSCHIMINISHKEVFEDTLFSLPSYEFNNLTSKLHCRNCHWDKTQIANRLHLHVHYFYWNEDYVWKAEGPMLKRAFVMPFHLRPLGNLLVPAPRDTYAVLQAHGMDKNCCNKGKTVPWSSLRKFYPLVQRNCEIRGIRETLMQQNMAIYSIVVDEPSYAI